MSCPYCENLQGFAILPAEPRKEGWGHKMKFLIAVIPDYNIECKDPPKEKKK